MLTLCLEADIVLRQTAKHIFTFSDIYDLIVDADFIDTRVFKLLCQSSAFQHSINAVFISNFDGTMSHDIPPLNE